MYALADALLRETSTRTSTLPDSSSQSASTELMLTWKLPGAVLLLTNRHKDADIGFSSDGEQSIRCVGSGYNCFQNLLSKSVRCGLCVGCSWFRLSVRHWKEAINVPAA